MRIWVDRLRRRVRESDGDSGFTLIEIVIGLMLFVLVAQGLAAVLITSSATSLFTRMSTTAKNLTQQRLDAMRSLPYHVDAQNGPYVDLLDLYYHDDSGTSGNIPNVVPGDTVPGVYVSAGGAGGPAGPYYRLTIAGSKIGSNYAKFTQYVYTQFLVANSPAAQYLSPLPSGYNNSAVGADHPLSPLIGVTVVETWQSNGKAHSYSTFTEITDQGANETLVVNQAKAIAVRIISQDYLNDSIVADVASVAANGSLSNGSQAGAEATGASVVDGTNTPTVGAQQTAVSPPNPATGQGSSTAGQAQVGITGSCGWASFGPTAVSDVSATTATATTSGVPTAPSDATGTATSPNITASLNAAGGGACAGMWLSNKIDGSPSPDPSLNLNPDTAMVRVQDQGGSSAEVTSAANVYTGSPAGAAGLVVATASAAMTTWVKIFPGLSFVPNAPAGYGINGQPGLVNVSLTKATLSCSSTSGGGTASTLSYNGLVAWYTTTGGWQERSFSWSSGTGGTDPLAVVDLSQPVNSLGTPLSAYVTSISGVTAVTGDNGGVQSIDAAVSVATVPTLGIAYPWTALGVELGHLSCVAQDNRS